MGLKARLMEWSGAALSCLFFIALLGTCSYGSHHARVVHGDPGIGMWSDTLGAFYYAGEAVLANHGPHVEDVPLPISEKRLREMWGDPMDSETRPDGFLGIAWPTRRADEIVYAMAKDGTVFFLGRGVRGPK